MTDVHTEHCCLKHGCMYGKDESCTVVQKTAKQSYPCEFCSVEEEQMQERGDVWQYGVQSRSSEHVMEGKEWTEQKVDQFLTAYNRARKYAKVRRRVSKWEEV